MQNLVTPIWIGKWWLNNATVNAVDADLVVVAIDQEDLDPEEEEEAAAVAEAAVAAATEREEIESAGRGLKLPYHRLIRYAYSLIVYAFFSWRSATDNHINFTALGQVEVTLNFLGIKPFHRAGTVSFSLHA